jgi:hypothetical protein
MPKRTTPPLLAPRSPADGSAEHVAAPSVDEKEKMGLWMSSTICQRLRIYAVSKRRGYGDVVEEALAMFFAAKAKEG